MAFKSKNREKDVKSSVKIKEFARFLLLAVTLVLMVPSIVPAANAQVSCTEEDTLKADVVALDQVFFYNRLGAWNPAGMMYGPRA